jgi:DNA-binding response OmpR family regulator
MINIEFDFSISILALDSDESSRRLLGETLGALGFTILQAGSIENARNILAQQKVDLVMADVFLPEGNGIEFMIRLKKERPEIPVIILAAAIDNATRDELLKNGADGVLAKPFRINLVEELITSTLIKYDTALLSTPVSTHKILVVDDDDSLLAFLVEAIKILGFETMACRDGTTAKEAFLQGKFDLVISDLMLPDTNGVTLLKELKNINPALPIAIVTGYPQVYSPQMAKTDGIDGYLGKPFRINQLEQVLSNLLYPEKTPKRQTI